MLRIVFCGSLSKALSIPAVKNAILRHMMF